MITKLSLGTSARATLSGRAALLTQEGIAFLYHPLFVQGHWKTSSPAKRSLSRRERMVRQEMRAG
jgi:hypothetical protein